ncbi:uncharacterized protein LOC135695650 isoform X2 [Rhopilema esculentum]|uniref:uncharacterized protein LOC135695650 isoform X2 n=1 Tax=Rhopilema esculentum TaxID=499914 RepID=UPI0031CE1BA5
MSTENAENLSVQSFAAVERQTTLPKAKTADIQVDVEKCRHLLSDTGHNERVSLALKLDGEKSAIKLMRSCLESNDFHSVWKSCHGYQNAALGFLMYIASAQQNATLRYLKSLTSNRFKQLREEIDKAVTAGVQLDTRLYDIPFEWLDKFASVISRAEMPENQYLQPTWQFLAGNAGLDQTTINNLEAPAVARKDLTLGLIIFLTQSAPSTTVAWLAIHLKEIGMNNVLLKENMFNKCFEEHCIRSVEKENTDGFEEFNGDLC